MGGGWFAPRPPQVQLILSSSNIGLFCYVLFCFVWAVEGHSAYFALRFVFKLYIFVDVVVAILSVTYLTSSRVISVLACIFPESMDVLKALSSLSV